MPSNKTLSTDTLFWTSCSLTGCTTNYTIEDMRKIVEVRMANDGLEGIARLINSIRKPFHIC